MKYDDAFPGPHDHWSEPAPGWLWVVQPGPCFCCGEATHWIGIPYDDFFCSTECMQAFDAEPTPRWAETEATPEEGRALRELIRRIRDGSPEPLSGHS